MNDRTAQTVAQSEQKHEEDSRILTSSVKCDSSNLTVECKTKESSGELSMEGQKKALRPLLSKLATTSLEFSEALPFAAFTSMLVEMVAKLDHVIDAVEDLGKLACFREFRDDDVEIFVTCERPKTNIFHNDLPSYGFE
ncbi:Aluminum-activated malate transporter [Sesbania bispinosa]|nr:Aluminum-activated malate transporter [Sesbania bispinosa]